MHQGELSMWDIPVSVGGFFFSGICVFKVFILYLLIRWRKSLEKGPDVQQLGFG